MHMSVHNFYFNGVKVGKPKFTRKGELIVENCHSVYSFLRTINSDFHKFNERVFIPDGITDCSNMFSFCEVFNQPVSIPDSATNCADMFNSCDQFNQPVKFSKSTTICDGMFAGCEKFNQPVELPDTVESSHDMFFNCKDFNQPLIIPDRDRIIARMLMGCINFRAPITFNGLLWSPALFETERYEVIFRLEPFDHFRSVLECPNNVEYFLSKEATIESFDAMLKYSTENHLVEMSARLLQFKQDHIDEFPKKDSLSWD